MILTVILWVALFIVALGLRDPWSPRRAATAALGGLAVGLLLSYFNMYAGSVRGVASLLAFALIVSGARIVRTMQQDSRPLHRFMPAAGGAVAILLLVSGLFPFTSWGANSAEDQVYSTLRANQVTADAPALERAQDVRVVPWDLASQLLVRGYGADASFLNAEANRVQRNTFPDTVRGEFWWVHAPAPEAAKWLFGGRLADKVVYVKNDANNLTPSVIPGELNVQLDGIWWQDRIARYAQENGELRYILQDVALQIDDDLQPHWIAYLASLDLRGQPHLAKLIIVNAHDGTEQVVSPGDAPAWIEMVYPESYVYEWVSYWGLHREGFIYRWFNAQGLVQPDDVTVRYIRLEDNTYWLLPMRQLASANLGGYVLVNTRSGVATFYDRFDDQLVDYDTAYTQLQAIMASGEATRGQGAIRLSISEGYLYPVRMADGSVRDAYVFPLLESLKVSKFAIIDAQDYNNRRIFADSMASALAQFARLTDGDDIKLPPPTTNATATDVKVVEGTADVARTLVNLNGTLYRVTLADLAGGARQEADREMDELILAMERANRGQDVTISVLIEGGKVVDVTYSGVDWG